MEYVNQALKNYEDNVIVTFCKCGRPIGLMRDEIRHQRSGIIATEFSALLHQYIAGVFEGGTLLDPFQENVSIHSFSLGNSVNDF